MADYVAKESIKMALPSGIRPFG
ncbi:uncharacterized protein G2W53_044247 [Senna tora]|uniref:Uncharacterized protein n=1 Tax=Senna tora TaxID=362788 RepID=A0A834SKK7_9FABA|nr:uncharacterized protein G2W53_044247 [Senna tora]